MSYHEVLVLSKEWTCGSTLPTKKGRRRKEPFLKARSGRGQRGSKAFCPKSVPSAIVLDDKREKVWAFTKPLGWHRMEDNQEIAVELTGSGQTLFSPVDKAAASIWAGKS